MDLIFQYCLNFLAKRKLIYCLNFLAKIYFINNDNNELHADNDPKYADKDREQKKDVSDRVFIKAEP